MAEIGDALIGAAIEEAEAHGVKVHIIHTREKKIGFCRACYGCAETGVCVQKDDFMDILCLAHEADAIIAEAPIYYNCMAAQMMTVINRLCCTFACKTYHVGPKKRVGMFLTCTGSEPEEMKRHVKNILTLPSVSPCYFAISDRGIYQCVPDSICHDRPDYLERARKIVRWAVEA